jgi:serine O-acetyltransferase
MNDAWAALKADTFRQYGEFSWRCLLNGVVSRRAFRVVVTMRLCQMAYSSRGSLRVFLLFFRMLHHLSTQLAGLDLSWRTDIQPGLAITHGWGLVISPNTRIGKNVTLFHGVTLGARHRIARDGERLAEYPVLEDEVWIGPHAIIVGGVTIGCGSRVAGGAFVTESVPPHSIVSGNPAVIIKSDCVPDVSFPAPV